MVLKQQESVKNNKTLIDIDAINDAYYRVNYNHSVLLGTGNAFNFKILQTH